MRRLLVIFFLAQQITQSAQRDDRGRTAVEFLTQPRNVDFDRVLARLVREREDRVDQGGLGYRLAQTQDQRFEHRALARRHVQRRALQRELARVDVEREIAAHYLARLRGRLAADRHLDARDQLAYFKRLDQVVVRAGAEQFHFFVD